ncbi:MAG TPA: STAS domain-containing protein [Acidimicrobiia bacterium]|jgi:anti-anti-sigma factor
MTAMLERPVGSPAQVAVERRREGGACHLTITGEIDATTALLVADGLARALDSGAARVYVELAGVTFCDASGLGLLIDARREARQRGLRLVLVAPAAPVRRLLDLTELDARFVINAAV